LLLLDEPTSAMDANTEQFVLRVLQLLKEKSGIIIISHKDSLTQLADRVYALQAGVSNVKYEKPSPKRVHNNSFTISSHS
jgi:ABC-type transport system involved in cytochrome bd biosynthesis fused ATPase/permease subunit